MFSGDPLRLGAERGDRRWFKGPNYPTNDIKSFKMAAILLREKTR